MREEEIRIFIVIETLTELNMLDYAVQKLGFSGSYFRRYREGEYNLPMVARIKMESFDISHQCFFLDVNTIQGLLNYLGINRRDGDIQMTLDEFLAKYIPELVSKEYLKKINSKIGGYKTGGLKYFDQVQEFSEELL